MRSAWRNHRVASRGWPNIRAWRKHALRIVLALLASPVSIGNAQTAPVDAHVFAEDTAREVAALVKPDAVLIVDAPDGYFKMAVVAQLEARGFLVSTRSVKGGIPTRFLLADGGRGRAARVDLVVGTTMLWRSYDRSNGKASGVWRNQAPTPTPVDQNTDESGQLYQLGRTIEHQSPDRAMNYYRLAAALGHKEANLRLGLLLVANGKAEDGIRFITVASNAGNAQADYILGLAYLNGTGIVKEPIRGRKLLRKAADAGIAAATQALGHEVAGR
ncbi:tetratricopeptide repeat protein [Sphingomonas sp. Leaf30]|uniref:tetratricopeptide repeat protein n=1 Tax=Sphingomonas sp. Leaf30 TaxID=1736213 RepID=UPI0006F55855|nr:SEL1-like repeat protein [Sphingomonas sp. Leaf30]KQN16512.1 hypothetical protein ASE89_07780 [Sphingomonas sp. Leaf30]